MSNKPTLGGRKPLSTKAQPKTRMGSYSQNLLDIPAGIKAELEAKGLEGRWISFKQYADNYGHHRNGWSIYKPDTKSPESVLFGNNPDGIVRRGDLALAARSKEHCEEHRDILKERADRQSKGFKKAKADELRQLAQSGADAEVFEGYDENG